MTIDDICKNCLAKNHCDVLPYSNNCNEVRAMAEYDREIYNKAIDDFAEKLHHEEFGNEYGVHIVLTPQQVDELAEQLKVGGENE